MVGKVNKEDYLRRREAWINRRRGVKPGGPFDPASRGRAIREMERQEAARGNRRSGLNLQSVNGPSSTTTWSSIGPAPLPKGQTQNLVKPVSGRVTSIAINPTNPNIVYVGAAQGGVYRTLDGGTTWTPLLDNAQTLAIGSVAIAPSQPSTVYVGTGEGNFACDTFFGVGIYRIDNADSASPVITGPLNKDGSNNDVFSGWSIDKIVVHPTNPDIIFVGVAWGRGGIGCALPPVFSRPGLFRSTDATSASPTFAKLTIAGAQFGTFDGVTDIEFEPGNPNNLLAGVIRESGSGVYRTTNALDATPTFTRTLAAGNRVEIAINKVGSQITVFAATGDNLGSLFRSTDGGATWSSAIGTSGFCDGQCTYDMPIAIDPTNANVVYLGGAGEYGSNSHILTKVTNALTTPTFTPMQDGLHPDEHAIEIDPTNSNIVWTGNDGGIFKSTDGASTWVSLNSRGFNATQFQSIALHPTDRYFTLGGTQDNGTEWLKPDNTWALADTGDGGYSLIDQNAADTTNVTMYHQTPFLDGFARVTNTAQAHEWGWTFIDIGALGDGPSEFYAPMALGPGNPNTVYFGSDRLWRSSDRGNTMTVVSQTALPAIAAIGISPQNDSVRVVGLDNGEVWRTTTGSSILDDVSGAIPRKYIGKVKVDPNDQNTAYVTLAGYFANSTAHIYKTTNLSNAAPTWTGIDGGQIPDIPVNAFAIDPANSNNLYAGTDIGVYQSTDGGTTWAPFGDGLPRVAVFDMAIQNSNRILRIATHGRGIWEISIDNNPGTLQGTIYDNYSAGAISGATVTLVNASTTTNGSGFYQFTNIPPGTYDIMVSAAGYSGGKLTGVVVPAGGTKTLSIGVTPAANSGCLIDTSQSDFQSGTANDSVDLGSSPGDVKLALTPIAALDQINTFSTGFIISPFLNGNNWYAQTFTAGDNGRLMSVDVLLSTASGGTPGTVTVEIRNTSGSSPGSTILASATLGVFSSTPFIFYNALFASPPTVTIGTKYAIVRHANTGGPFRSLVKGSDSYSGGGVATSTNSGTSWSLFTDDMWFNTYIAPQLYLFAGTLISSVKDASAAPGGTANWTTLSWTATTPSILGQHSFVVFQVAGSNNAGGPFNFVGPDGTANTFFTTSGASLSQFNGNRYLMYKAYLGTINNFITPTLSDVTVCFSNTLGVDTVWPVAGRASGAQTLTITGELAGLSTVTMGGTPVAWSYAIGTSAIEFTTPAHAVGAVDIVLTPTSGSPVTRTKAFAYLPTVFTDDTLTVGVTTAKAQHILEIRQAVDALRAVAGLGSAPWTDPTLSPFSTMIRAVHILELRTLLEDAASRLGYPPGPGYTDPGVTSGFVIKKAHIEDLRQRIRNIAG
jgi:photosystem II stability/assembly factor-like uncharacterized protein